VVACTQMLWRHFWSECFGKKLIKKD
jgi:hypothetical protein